jgi:hypothetical protein
MVSPDDQEEAVKARASRFMLGTWCWENQHQRIRNTFHGDSTWRHELYDKDRNVNRHWALKWRVLRVANGVIYVEFQSSTAETMMIIEVEPRGDSLRI